MTVSSLFLIEQPVYCTSAPGLQLLLHQLFGGGELAELDLGHVVVGADRADHLGLLLLAVLGLNVDPRDFPNERQAKPERYYTFFKAMPVTFPFWKAAAPFELVDEERSQAHEHHAEQHQHGRAAVDGVGVDERR